MKRWLTHLVTIGVFCSLVMPFASAMIFRPAAVVNMWDTWLYEHEGTYYLFYLAVQKSGWDGFGLATSQDGVHWDDKGIVVSKADDAVWLGTGSVWPSSAFETDGRFIANFSEWRDDPPGVGQQAIFFADSTDLIHWTRRDDIEFKADPRWYNVNQGNNSRWDCIYSIPKEGGGRYGYWTANPKSFVGFGFGQTEDGIHWEALEPPVINWGNTPPMGGCELGAVEQVEDRYYAMVGSWGYRDQTGMFIFTAPAPGGPYTPVQKNFALLTSRGHTNTYFARFFPSQDGLLVNHHSIVRSGGVYFAPLKRALVDAEGVMRLHYWEGNEALKGEQLEVKVGDVQSAAIEGMRVTFIEPAFDGERGFIIEGDMQNLPLEPAADNFKGIGLYIEEKADQGSGIMIFTRSHVEYGSIRRKSRFARGDWFDRAIEPRNQCRFRLLIRQSLSELYIDDVFIQSYSLPETLTGRVGMVSVENAATVHNVRAWAMSLSKPNYGLAYKKPAKTSSVYDPNFTADRAFDGNRNTRWSSGLPYGKSEWISVDLGSVQTIHRVRLYWEIAFAKWYEIQVSNDELEWTTVYQTDRGGGGVESIGGLQVEGRYLRLNCVERGSEHGFSLWEIQIDGD